MPRSYGKYFVNGTIGPVTFYQYKGIPVARVRTSLNKKKMAANPNFEKFRTHSKKMGMAAKLASEIYQTLPDAIRKHALYQYLKQVAYRMLREDYTEDEVRDKLIAII